MDINHLHLAVADVNRSEKFYSEHLGFKRKTVHGKILFLTNEAGFDLALDPEYAPEKLPDWFHFGFRLESSVEVRDLFAKMTEKSVTIHKALQEYNDWIFFRCADPDGYLIEVYWE